MSSTNKPTSSHKLKTYSILEEYEVAWNQKLGCGVSGPVRPCRNKATGERRALKCLIDRPRARQEINMHLKCISHPNIVHIYDIYANEVQFPGEPEPKSRLLVVMELMDGGELFDQISKQKCFTESQAARYTRQISLAIQRCHSLNIAHRDIKPENLLLSDNSEEALIKLSDFGFAKKDQGDLKTPHFTPYYVAPQVLVAQKHQAKEKYHILPNSPYTYDRSCDMWSLGVIVYIMLCGYPPFYSETPSKQLSRMMKRKIMAGHYEFPDEDWKRVSTLAKSLVAKLLRVNPEERLTADEILRDPWLSEAPDTQLQSPAVMLDKNALFDAKQEHSRQLTSMRLPDNQLKLKPLTNVNNPILRKRHANAAVSTRSAVVTKPVDPGIQKIRDIIAFCVLPPSNTGAGVNSTSLDGLVFNASQHYEKENKAFERILTQFKWNGQTFPDDINTKQFACVLSEYITNLTKS